MPVAVSDFMNRASLLLSPLLSVLTGCALLSGCTSPGASDSNGQTAAASHETVDATVATPAGEPPVATEIDLDEINLDEIDLDDVSEDGERTLGSVAIQDGRASLVFPDAHLPIAMSFVVETDREELTLERQDGRTFVNLSPSDLLGLLRGQSTVVGEWGSQLAAFELTPRARAEGFDAVSVVVSNEIDALELRGYASTSVTRMTLSIGSERYDVRAEAPEQGQVEWEFVFSVQASRFLEAWTSGKPMRLTSTHDLSPESVPLVIGGNLQEEQEDCGL